MDKTHAAVQGATDDDLGNWLEALPTAAAVLDAESHILCANAAWADMIGAEDGFAVGNNAFSVFANCAIQGLDAGEVIGEGLVRVLQEGGDVQYKIAAPADFGPASSYEVTLHRLRLRQRDHVMVTCRAMIAEVPSDRNLEALVATLPDAVISLDLSGEITGWNAAAERLYGYRRDEVLGKSVEILYPPDWPQRVQDYIADVVAEGRSFFEVQRVTKSGVTRMIEVTAAPIRAANGEIIGISNVNRDVTELRQTHDRLKSILDNLFAFVGILDLDGTLLEANRAPLAVAGLSPEDVIGRPFWECYWWSHAPQVQADLREACQRAIKGETVRYDTQVRIAGGQLIWIDFQVAPVLNEEGAIINLLPSGIDITERKDALKALHVSHDSFRRLVTRSPFGIYLVDADFRIAIVSNGAQKAFTNVRPLIGRDLGEALRILWPEPFATEAISRFQHTLATGEPYRSPRTVERRNDIDEVESYDWTIERITMPDGRPGVVCNFYDLSERQRYEEHIRLLMREVNHRSKNLLTVVTSMARQTARDCPPDEFVGRFSNRLLGLAASQDLIVKGQWAGVTVQDLVQSQLRHLDADTDALRVKVEGPDFMLAPDAAQGIGMALHELGTNALKYGALSVPSGTVSVQWGSHDDNAFFHMEWIETGGPPVQAPDRLGFGTTVTERMAADSVGGEVDLEYSSEGVKWKLVAPYENVVAS